MDAPAAAVTAVHTFAVLSARMKQVVWVRMADTVLTESLHQVPIISPVCRPRSHVVVAGLVNGTWSAAADLLRVDPQDLPSTRSVLFWHDLVLPSVPQKPVPHLVVGPYYITLNTQREALKEQPPLLAK